MPHSNKNIFETKFGDIVTEKTRRIEDTSLLKWFLFSGDGAF
jgi:hypothetical protein